MSKKRPALGRGLGALLPPRTAQPAAASAPSQDVTGPPRTLPIERIAPNPDQPRKHFDAELLAQLAASIREHGIVQPLLVTPASPAVGGPWVLVAGERRWRAAQKAGLTHVPVVVRDDTDERERLELALVENIQRADLDPIEEARAYAHLIAIGDFTQEALASRVGKDRSTVANALRLLRLPERVQAMVTEGRLSMGHARALLGLQHEDEITALANEVARDGLSVRATERAVRRRNAPPAEPAALDDDAKRRQIIVGELENRLRRRLGVRVRLRQRTGKGAGALEIPYGSLDELDRLLQVILGTPS